MSENKKTVKDLEKEERNAFLGWFSGGWPEVHQYEDEPDKVVFGKMECQLVPFRDFWLKKMVEYGWFDIEIVREGIAKGKIGQPSFTVYEIKPTEAGIKARNDFYYG